MRTFYWFPSCPCEGTMLFVLEVPFISQLDRDPERLRQGVSPWTPASPCSITRATSGDGGQSAACVHRPRFLHPWQPTIVLFFTWECNWAEHAKCLCEPSCQGGRKRPQPCPRHSPLLKIHKVPFIQVFHLSCKSYCVFILCGAWWCLNHMVSVLRGARSRERLIQLKPCPTGALGARPTAEGLAAPAFKEWVGSEDESRTREAFWKGWRRRAFQREFRVGALGNQKGGKFGWLTGNLLNVREEKRM